MSDLPATRSRRVRSVVESACWLVFCVVAFALTYQFDEPLPMFELGAAFWPRVMLIGIAAAALVMMIGSILTKDGDNTDSVQQTSADSSHSVSAQTWRERGRIVLVFLVPILFVYAMHKLGFLLVAPFFLAAYMYLFGVRRWVPLVSVTVGVYAAVVVIFVKLIFTPLPQGAGVFYTINGHLLGLLQ